MQTISSNNWKNSFDFSRRHTSSYFTWDNKTWSAISREKGEVLAGTLILEHFNATLVSNREIEPPRGVSAWIRACRAWIGLVREYHGEGQGFTISSRWASSIYLRARGTRAYTPRCHRCNEACRSYTLPFTSLLLQWRIHDKRKYIYNVLYSCNAANEWKPHRD